MTTARVALGESAATAVLVMVALLSRLADEELRSAQGALVGSAALGLGTGLVITTFAPLSKSQANPFVSVAAAFGGRQPWSETLLRVVAQAIGAGAATVLALLVPSLGAVSSGGRPLADAVSAFGFLLVGLGVAPRRDLRVPFAHGAFAMASFWMTGRSTLGNPLVLLSFGVLGRAHASLASTEIALAAVAVGSGLGATLAYLLFPSGRQALSLLLYAPLRSGNREGGSSSPRSS